jgi:hypothetical protein
MENLHLDQGAIVVADCPIAFKKKKAKVIQRRQLPNTNLWILEFYKGGQLPKELKGRWSNILELEKAVHKYVEWLEKKRAGRERWQRHQRYFNWKNGKPWLKQKK